MSKEVASPVAREDAPDDHEEQTANEHRKPPLWLKTVHQPAKAEGQEWYKHIELPLNSQRPEWTINTLKGGRIRIHEKDQKQEQFAPVCRLQVLRVCQQDDQEERGIIAWENAQDTTQVKRTD